MGKQVLDIGLSPNDGTGDTLRTAATKINSNFDELYNATAASVNLIVAGEGVATTNDLGNITITNSRPNRGAFKTIHVVKGENNKDVSTSDLEGELTLVAGLNVQVDANNATKTITISVPELRSDEIYGTLTGFLNGNVTGNVIGDVTGNLIGNARITNLEVAGNAGAAVAQFNLLTSQKLSLNSDIVSLEGQLSAAQDDLDTAESNLAFWQAEPPSAQRTANIAQYQSEIATLITTIDGLEDTLLTKQNQLAAVDAQRNLLQDSISTPYASITYDTTNLTLSSNRKLDVPSITTQNPFVLTNHTTSERDDLDAVPGMIIFNLTAKKVQVWDGDTWQDLN